MMNLKESKTRGEAQRAMIIEAARASRSYYLYGEPTAVPEAMRTILVDTLGWITDEQFKAAMEVAEYDLLPLLDELEQEQLEYEYSRIHNT